MAADIPERSADIGQGMQALGLPAADAPALALAMLVTRLGRLNELLMAGLLAEQFGDARQGMGEPWVLATLALRGPPHRASPTELCRISLLTSGGMTKALGNLERAGLVARRADPADRRALLVELTADGVAAARAMLARIAERYAPLAPGGPADIQAALRPLLSRLEALLGRPDSAPWLHAP